MGGIYIRKEGHDIRPGLGIMWDHVSRGFVLRIGDWYVWCRWSMRAKHLNLRHGKIRHEEFGTETIFPIEGKEFKDGKWIDSHMH